MKLINDIVEFIGYTILGIIFGGAPFALLFYYGVLK